MTTWYYYVPEITARSTDGYWSMEAPYRTKALCLARIDADERPTETPHQMAIRSFPYPPEGISQSVNNPK